MHQMMLVVEASHVLQQLHGPVELVGGQLVHQKEVVAIRNADEVEVGIAVGLQ